MYSVVKSFTSYSIKFAFRKFVPILLGAPSIYAQYPMASCAFTQFYLHAGLSEQSVNVYDSNGNRLWTIERLSSHSNVWIIYSGVDRRAVAKITFGYFDRHVNFCSNSQIDNAHFSRDYRCGGFFNCAFSLKSGDHYVWTRQSQSLEKVVFRGDGKQERVRVGSATLLRKWKFAWRIDVEESFPALVAVATAFIPMKSQWDMATTSANLGRQEMNDLDISNIASIDPQKEVSLIPTSPKFTVRAVTRLMHSADAKLCQTMQKETASRLDNHEDDHRLPVCKTASQKHNHLNLQYEEPPTDMEFFNPVSFPRQSQ